MQTLTKEHTTNKNKKIVVKTALFTEIITTVLLPTAKPAVVVVATPFIKPIVDVVAARISAFQPITAATAPQQHTPTIVRISTKSTIARTIHPHDPRARGTPKSAYMMLREIVETLDPSTNTNGWSPHNLLKHIVQLTTNHVIIAIEAPTNSSAIHPLSDLIEALTTLPLKKQGRVSIVIVTDAGSPNDCCKLPHNIITRCIVDARAVCSRLEIPLVQKIVRDSFWQPCKPFLTTTDLDGNGISSIIAITASKVVEQTACNYQAALKSVVAILPPPHKPLDVHALTPAALAITLAKKIPTLSQEFAAILISTSPSPSTLTIPIPKVIIHANNISKSITVGSLTHCAKTLASLYPALISLKKERHSNYLSISISKDLVIPHHDIERVVSYIIKSPTNQKRQETTNTWNFQQLSHNELAALAAIDSCERVTHPAKPLTVANIYQTYKKTTKPLKTTPYSYRNFSKLTAKIRRHSNSLVISRQQNTRGRPNLHLLALEKSHRKLIRSLLQNATPHCSPSTTHIKQILNSLAAANANRPNEILAQIIHIAKKSKKVIFRSIVELYSTYCSASKKTISRAAFYSFISSMLNQNIFSNTCSHTISLAPNTIITQIKPPPLDATW